MLICKVVIVIQNIEYLYETNKLKKKLKNNLIIIKNKGENALKYKQFVFVGFQQWKTTQTKNGYNLFYLDLSTIQTRMVQKKKM